MRAKLYFSLILVGMSWIFAPLAFAQGEVSGVIGGLLGGNLDVRNDLTVDTGLNNAVLYGIRGGWYGEPRRRGRLSE
jgi:hypothetical protein